MMSPGPLFLAWKYRLLNVGHCLAAKSKLATSYDEMGVDDHSADDKKGSGSWGPAKTSFAYI